MKKFLPLLVLLAIVVIFFRQFFINNLLPIPADTIVGLYNPFRDFYAKDYPRGIPFKNFLITDPVRQQYPWRLESILQEKKWQFPLWNPYNFAGNPLLGNQQSASLTPFNLFFFLMPFPLAWSLLIFLQPLLAGFFTYLYLRNLKISKIPSLLGSIAFIFSGFFVAWFAWGTIDATALWLPLILLSVDKIFQNKKYKWYGIYFLAHIIAFFSGHVQTFVYMVLLTHGYIGMRLIASKERVKALLVGLPFGLLTIIITSILWFPFLQFILLSGRSMDLVMQEGWFIPYQHLTTFFVPDFFGNPATFNYWGVWNYGELAGYIGIVPLFFALYAAIANKSKTVWFFLVAFFIALLFALPTFFAQLPLILHIPFLATAQPTRMMVLIDFSLSIMAAFGLNEFLQNQKRVYIPVAVFSLVFMGIWGAVIFHAKLFPQVLLTNILVAKHNLVFPTSVFASLVIFVLIMVFMRKNKIVFLSCAVLLFALSSFDGIRFADKFTPFVNPAYLYPSTKTIAFLQSHIENYRIMTTDSQLLPPNFSLVYHLQSVDGYDPLYIKQYGELIAAIERNKPDIHEPFGFNRIITPHNYQNRLVNLLGVKYILSLTDLHDKNLQKIFTEGQTQVYENKTVFPRAFFVSTIQSVKTDQQAINFLFNLKNNLQTSVAISGNLQNKNNLAIGLVKILSYTDNVIVLQTKNAGDGFLVLTDAFYPSWHVFIDGKEEKIYQTDLAFRGVFVPKGTHSVQFTVQLFSL